MRQKYLVLVLILLLPMLSVVWPWPPAALAAVNYNRLLDDGVLDKTDSMKASQINSFLNSFTNSCISPNNGFASQDPIGYSPDNGFKYGSVVSAGKVIYDAAQAYEVNPQVLLVTLEKEEGLVRGNAGCSKWRYASAMGYNCPDSSNLYNYKNIYLYTLNGKAYRSIKDTCVGGSKDPNWAKIGFSRQLIWAAWLLKRGEQRSEGNIDWKIVKPHWNNSDEKDCYGGPMTQGDRKLCASDSKTTYFDGYTTIDGSAVHMDTGATASLYWYTPHKHGNLNFYNIFSDWFGNPAANTSKDGVIAGDWNRAAEFRDFDSPAVRRGNLYFFDNNLDGNVDSFFGIGRMTDKVIIGDWDGDDDASIGLRRGTDYYLLTSGGKVQFHYKLGKASDTVLVGDWNGDGIDSLGLKRGSTYYIDRNNNGKLDARFSIGRATDQVIVGRWNGINDGIGLKRDKYYYLDNNNNGQADISFGIGRATDKAFAGRWGDDGKDYIGLRRGKYYYFDTNNNRTAETTFGIGRDTDKLVVGDWNNDGTDTIGLKRGSDFYLLNSNGTSFKTYVYTY